MIVVSIAASLDEAGLRELTTDSTVAVAAVIVIGIFSSYEL